MKKIYFPAFRKWSKGKIEEFKIYLLAFRAFVNGKLEEFNVYIIKQFLDHTDTAGYDWT